MHGQQGPVRCLMDASVVWSEAWFNPLCSHNICSTQYVDSQSNLTAVQLYNPPKVHTVRILTS